MRRLAVIRLCFAANSFSPGIAGREAFERREWAAGDAAMETAHDAETEFAAVLDFIADKPDWEVTVLRCASAPAAGLMDDDLFQEFYDEVLARLAGTRWDAVYLSLHGAALTTRRTRPELSLIVAVRNAIGDVPLGASFSLHANVAPEIAQYLTYASAYRTHPATDKRATAARVLDAIAKTAEGRLRPVGAVVKVPALLPPAHWETDHGPMADVQALARILESGHVLDASVLGGFAYGDTVDAGGAGMAFADEDRAAARRSAQAIANALFERRREFAATLLGPFAGLKEALAAPPGLVCITDANDSVLLGGAGDTPGLFRALTTMKPDVRSVVASFCDRGAVARAVAAGVGRPLKLELGGRTTAEFGAPVPVEATIRRLTNGTFMNDGPVDRGLIVHLGRTAVLRAGNIDIILTETAHAPTDPAFFALHGIDLDRTRLLVAKAGSDMHPAFARRAVRIVEVDAPGPAPLDLARLPYRRVPADLKPPAAPA